MPGGEIGYLDCDTDSGEYMIMSQGGNTIGCTTNIGNLAIEMAIYNLNVQHDLEVQIKTLNDTYNLDEWVNLTDPPGDDGFIDYQDCDFVEIDRDYYSPVYDPSYCHPGDVTPLCDLDASLEAESHFLLGRDYIPTGGIGDLRITTELTGDVTGVGADVVFVVDASGSMESPKIDQARDAIISIIEEFMQSELAGQNAFGAVGFFDEPYLVLPLSTDSSLQHLEDEIGRLTANGYTSVGDGLCMAQSMLIFHSCVNSSTDFIILASDGKENRPSWVADVKDMIADNTTVYTIGIDPAGIDEEWEDVLKSIAKSGSGRGKYFYTPSAGQLENIFDKIIREIKTFIPKHEATLTVELGPYMEYISSSIDPSQVDGNTLTYVMKDLSVQEPTPIDIKYRMTGIGTGYEVLSSAEIVFDSFGICPDTSDTAGPLLIDGDDDSLSIDLTISHAPSIDGATDDDITFTADLTYSDDTHTDEHFSNANCVVTFSDIAGTYNMAEGVTKYTYTRNDRFDDLAATYTVTCSSGSYSWSKVGTLYAIKTTPEEDQSKITNNENFDIGLYLLMKVQFYNEAIGEWIDEVILFNDSSTGTIRTIRADSYIALDKIWNVKTIYGGWNTTTNTHGSGTYRAYVAVTDREGNLVKDKDDNLIEAYYNFSLSLNILPTHSTPILNSTYGTNYSYENLTCYNQSTYDADGDDVINTIGWYRNNLELHSFENTTTINYTNTLAGENWSCSITPSDGIGYGISKSSVNLTIKNACGNNYCDSDENYVNTGATGSTGGTVGSPGNPCTEGSCVCLNHRMMCSIQAINVVYCGPC